MNTIYYRFCILILVFLSFTSEAQQPSVSPSPQLSIDQAKEIISAGKDDHYVAFRVIESAFKNADAQERKALKLRLAPWVLGLMNAPVNPNEEWTDWHTSRSSACALAGALKIEEAVPSLIQLLSPLLGQRRNPFLRRLPGENVSYDTPAIYALIQIGKSAEAPLNAALNAINDSWSMYSKQYQEKKGVTYQEIEDYDNVLNKRRLIEYILKQLSPVDE